MTNKYDNVYINDSYSIAGMYESDGPLKKYFDRLYDDDMYFGEKSFEKAEIKMLRDCISCLLEVSKKKEKDYHKKKFEQCKENNIHLLSIWDDLWLLKRDVCKSAINTLLGLNKTVEGYLCDVRPVYNLLMSSFVSENYMYNYKQSQYGLALFYENEPVAMITYNLSYIKIDIIHYVIKSIWFELSTKIQ